MRVRTVRPGVVGRPPPPALRNLVFGLLVLSLVAAWSADLLVPIVLPDHPLGLLLLTDRVRILALVSNQLDPLTFYVVGLTRMMLPNPLYFFLGRWYGERCIAWVQGRSRGSGRFLRWSQRVFARAPRTFVALVPTNVTIVLAGTSGMTFGSFFLANVLGAIAILITIRRLSDFFSVHLAELDRLVAANRPAFFVIALILVGFAVRSHVRRPALIGTASDERLQGAASAPDASDQSTDATSSAATPSGDAPPW